MVFLTPKRAIFVVFLSAAVQFAVHPLARAKDGEIDPALRAYLTANGLLNRGLNELAVEEYRSFLSANANHANVPSARYGLSVALFRLQKFADALKELEPLSKQQDFEFAAEVAVMRGQCLLALDDPEPAVAAFRAVQLADEHDLADDMSSGLAEALYQTGKLNEARQEAKRFAGSFGKSPLRDRVELFAGLAEMAQADFAASGERFEAFRKTFPESPYGEQVLLLLAQSRHQSGQAEAAMEHYKAVLEQKNEQYAAEALLGFGTLLYRAEKYEAAGKTLDQLIERFPDAPFIGRGYFYRGKVAFAREQYPQAYAALEKAAEKDKELADQCAYWMAKCQLREGNAEAAAATLASAAGKFSDSQLGAEMIYDRAIALLRTGKTQEAADALAEFRSKFPTHTLTPEVLNLLAGVEHQAGDYASSAVHCAEFLKNYGSHSLAAAMLFLSAENAFLSKEYADSVAKYQKFLQDYSGDPQADKARLRLGLALYRLDKTDESLQQLEPIANLAAKDAVFLPALLTLGDIYFMRSEWKRAEDYLQNYLKKSEAGEGTDDVVFKVGYAQQRQNDLEHALAAYRLVVEQYPDSPHRLQAIFETGQILVSANKPKEAEVAFRRVLEDGGESSRFAAYALNHLAAIAAQSGDAKAAAELYARAAGSSDGGESAVAQFHQAQSLMSASAFAEAEAVLRKLLSANADFAQAAEAKAQLAIALARLDRHEDAITLIAEVEPNSARLSPELQASLQYEKAWCLRKLGRDDAAADSYAKILGGASSADLQVHSMLELAELHVKARKFEEASDVLERLHEKLADMPKGENAAVREQCAYQRGACAFELGRFDRAADLYAAFIDEFPNSELIASASYFAGESFFKIGRHEKAVEHLARVAEKHASSEVAAASLLRLGESLAALQRWPKSEQAFQEYLSRFADSDAWYQAQFGIGWARENQKQYDDAILEYVKVVGRHQGPTAARAQFQIGECLFAKGSCEDAIRELLKVDILYAYPQWSAAATYEVGRCFEKLGKSAEAKSHYQMVVDKHKDTEWANPAAKHLSELAAAGIPGR